MHREIAKVNFALVDDSFAAADLMQDLIGQTNMGVFDNVAHSW